MSKPIKNPETEARCAEIAQVAKSDPSTANRQFQEWVDDPALKLKLWEKLALKDRVLALIRE